jgi:2-dehydropantoate 2-reductase
MKIAVLGAGAMGSLFGGLLAQTGNEVILVDVSRETVTAINDDGLYMESRFREPLTIRIRATSIPAEIGPVDLVIVFVKSYDTEVAIRGAQALIGANTSVLTLQNGWGNADRMAATVGREHVLVGLTYQSATVLGPGRVSHTARGKTVIGELDGTTTDRLRQIVEVLNAAGIETTQSPNVLHEVWTKLATNATVLPVAALLRFYAGQLVEHAGTLELMRALLHETVAVANAQGIPLNEEERWEAITDSARRGPTVKVSMLQDVEKGRRTEIDAVNGAVVDAGRRLNIPTPHHEAVVCLVRALEESLVSRPS